jgi:hypothetical protein
VTVKKVWKDGANIDGTRPDSVLVQLYANGVTVGAPVRLNKLNNWTYTWSNLDLKSGGAKIAYTVRELEVPDKYTVTITGDAVYGYTITNTYEPETTPPPPPPPPETETPPPPPPETETPPPPPETETTPPETEPPTPPVEVPPEEPVPQTNVEGSVVRYAIPMGAAALVLIGAALISGKKKKDEEEDKDV